MKPKAIRVLGRFGYFKIWFCLIDNDVSKLKKRREGAIKSEDFCFYLRFNNDTFIEVTDIFTEDTRGALNLALERCYSGSLDVPDAIVETPIMNEDWHLKPTIHPIIPIGRYDFFDIYASAKYEYLESIKQHQLSEFMLFFRRPTGEYIFTFNTLEAKDQQAIMLDSMSKFVVDPV